MTYGLTENGWVVRRADEWLVLIRQEYETLVGLTIDWERDTVLGNLSVVMANMLANLDEAAQDAFNARDPGNALGLALDNLCAIVFVTRLKAAYSTVTLSCGGTAGTTILAGSIAEGGGDDGKARWISMADGVIGTGPIDILFQAETKGATVATIGQIIKIVTPITGWATVINAAAASPGRDRETNTALRLRRASSLQIAGGGNCAAIRANILTVDGVLAATVQENDEIVSAVINGITMDPVSIAAIVHPSTLTATQQIAVARTIYERLSSATATMGAVAHFVTQADGVTKDINFDWASTLIANTRTTVVMKPGWAIGDVNTAIAEIVEGYFSLLNPSEPIYGWAIESLIGASLSSFLYSATVEFDVGGGWVTNHTPNATELCELGTNVVTV